MIAINRDGAKIHLIPEMPQEFSLYQIITFRFLHLVAVFKIRIRLSSRPRVRLTDTAFHYRRNSVPKASQRVPHRSGYTLPRKVH